MARERITEPDQLEGTEHLSDGEIVARSIPLLRLSASTPPATRMRLREHIVLAAFEVLSDWKRSPILDGQPAAFGGFYAARLRHRVLAIDEREHPELYDNGVYRPDRALEPRPDEELEQLAARASEEIDRDEVSPETLIAAMIAGKIPTPSQVAPMELVAGVLDGSIEDDVTDPGRKAARAIGAKSAATGPLHRAQNVADLGTATAEDYRRALEVELERLRRTS